ncbi:87a3f0f4-1704-4623-890f-09371f03413b [Thermothielavioides terrestris]|jgi:hypothetical protein|uniref:Uncharacterized protein n=2 Tax=Thermothielavioides terrestris TaxID=2587410 RepID=G2QVQ5_THETT|nr:uncharacterized protein THITE_2109431 [Thermothielavioides terrestris NRRL 8126]AEO63836.1 hypothetical protein THITE_2109431 [Thermothielavioides terrestris NRRL 8126]SPQ23437.1 87a3f0f4-1704-4623-890f-09371f03413b [Thermothielavioides terrestris]
MDNADGKTLTSASSRPASIRSTASSVTLAVNDEARNVPNNATNTGNATTTNTDATNSPSRLRQPHDYRYTKPTGRPPNPNAQPKQKGKLGQFMERFQTPAVRRSIEIAEREKLRAERTGVRVRSSTGAPAGSGQSFGTWL